MKNRYDNLLQKHNKDILALCPYNPLFFRHIAREIKARDTKRGSILEIGCGEGDSALPVLDTTRSSLTLLDVSPEMIATCKRRFREFKKRVQYVCQDASTYLAQSTAHSIIYTAWTLHNFTQRNKWKLLRDIYSNLTPGGTFILADKVYREASWRKLFNHQSARYARYLPPAVAEAIIAHELEDTTENYRMEEKVLLKKMREIGFKNIEIIDRLERDIVLVAEK